MEPLGSILRRTLRELGIEKPLKRAEAIQIWSNAVGEHISQVTEPQFFSNGKIFVKVKSDVWRNELFFHKTDLVRRLNQILGEPTVKDIVFK